MQIFRKLCAQTARAIRQSKPKAILRMECPTSTPLRVYVVLFTTDRMDVRVMWRRL